VTTIHATEHGRHQGWVDKHPQSYIHGVERWITNRSERTIACSHYMREQIVDIFGVEEERVSVIPNGIDPDAPVQDPVELKRRGPSSPPRPEPRSVDQPPCLRRDFQLALRLCHVVIEEVPGTRFWSPGRGPTRPSCQAGRGPGPGKHGRFLGWIGDVLHSLYAIADLTVVPSIYEPSAWWLEAMASGCPCIVADTGASFPTRGGLRFPPVIEALSSRDPGPLRRSWAAWSPRPTSTASTGRHRRTDIGGLHRAGREAAPPDSALPRQREAG
jgi:glycogen(starch) synthase